MCFRASQYISFLSVSPKATSYFAFTCLVFSIVIVNSSHLSWSLSVQFSSKINDINYMIRSLIFFFLRDCSWNTVLSNWAGCPLVLLLSCHSGSSHCFSPRLEFLSFLISSLVLFEHIHQYFHLVKKVT